MEQSGFAQVDWDTSGIKVFCTDQVILDRLITNLKEYVSNFRVVAKYALVSGEVVGFWIDQLQGKDAKIGWWFVKQFCQQGWEPLESSGFGTGDGFMKMRKPL